MVFLPDFGDYWWVTESMDSLYLGFQVKDRLLIFAGL
jgi:hypothetical protein